MKNYTAISNVGIVKSELTIFGINLLRCWLYPLLESKTAFALSYRKLNGKKLNQPEPIIQISLKILFFCKINNLVHNSLSLKSI